MKDILQTNKQAEREGTILEIMRMSTEDGPGVRTTVFFKGCSLRCAWCHNPESLERKPQLQWINVKCIGCKTCIEVCPHKALFFSEDSGITIDRNVCDGCGACTDQCPSTALELWGKKWTVDALVREVIKDASYFGTSGGITASGGEAALQATFVSEFFKELKKRGIHTALDTSGQCSINNLNLILPYTDLLLYDIKEIDPCKHKEFTGSDNEIILTNLSYIAEHYSSHTHPSEVWIRTPIIPNATAREDNLRGIGAYIAKHLSTIVTRWELCAFNNLCRDKYQRLGIDWAFGATRLITRETLDNLAQAAKSSGVNPDIVFCSGSTDISDDEIKLSDAKPASPKRFSTC